MRTTITLDADVESLVKKAMLERGLTFKQAVNTAIRTGLGADGPRADYHFPTYDMGAPTRDLTHALHAAAELEDDEIARELNVGR